MYEGDNYQHVVGVLLVKSLIVINPQNRVTVSQLTHREPLIVRPNYGLLEMLSLFRKGHCHLAFVSNDALTARNNLRNGLPQSDESAIIGIVTLEDVVEEILQDEIVDETDCDSYDLLQARSKVLHNGVVKIKSTLPVPRNFASRGSVGSPLERRLTHFVAHNPEGANLFTPPISLMKETSKDFEMVKRPITLHIPGAPDVVDGSEERIKDAYNLEISTP